MHVRRATITLPDDLNDELERFRARQTGKPSLTSLAEIAFRKLLADPIPDEEEGGSLIRRVLANRSAIKTIASRHGATNVRLFGSVARGQESSGSDIDLLATLEPGRTLFDLAAIRSELEELLEVVVDVVPDSNLGGELREEILGEALTL